MLLELLAIHPKVSTERNPQLRCQIFFLKKLLFEMYQPFYSLNISNELKEREIGFQISYDNFIGLLLLYVFTIKTLLITFYFNLCQMKPSQICERVRKCNMMIMRVWRLLQAIRVHSKQLMRLSKAIKQSDLITEMKPVKVEGLQKEAEYRSKKKKKEIQ